MQFNVSRPQKIGVCFFFYTYYSIFIHHIDNKHTLSLVEMEQKREYLFKVLVIGELATGKTALVKRYVHNFFSEHYRATVRILVGYLSLV